MKNSDDKLTHPATSHFLTDAVKENIDSVSDFYEREEAKISQTQNLIERISCHFGSPLYFGGFILFVVVWVAPKAASWLIAAGAKAWIFATPHFSGSNRVSRGESDGF